MFYHLLKRQNHSVFEFGAVGETENRIGEGVEDFEEIGAVDSGICCFFWECKQIQIYFRDGNGPWGAAWKNWGEAMELFRNCEVLGK